MTIAIDFDNTWTADVALWRQFAVDAKKRGHDVIIVTARNGWSEDMLRHFDDELPLFYTWGKLKRPFMESLKIAVDIWIDDMPGTIEPCRKLPDLFSPDRGLAKWPGSSHQPDTIEPRLSDANDADM